MTVEKGNNLDCGVDVEKSSASGTLRCGPCGARYTEAVTERRCEGRMNVKKNGTIKIKGMETTMPILVENVSFHGGRIRYTGDISLFYSRNNNDNSILMLDVDGLQLHTFAKVVWTAPVNNEESKAGLRFIWRS